MKILTVIAWLLAIEFTLIGCLVFSGLINAILLVRLARRGRTLRRAALAKAEGSRELRLVTRHLVELSGRHTQLWAKLGELQVAIREQDRTLQMQRMLLSRIRGAACPCERGRQ